MGLIQDVHVAQSQSQRLRRSLPDPRYVSHGVLHIHAYVTWCAVRCATLRRPLLMIAYHSLWDSAFIFLCPGVDLAFLVAPLPRCLLCPILVVLAVVVSTSSSRRRLDIVISSSSRHRHLVVVVAAVVISSARECTGPCVSAQDHA